MTMEDTENEQEGSLYETWELPRCWVLYALGDSHRSLVELQQAKGAGKDFLTLQSKMSGGSWK